MTIDFTKEELDLIREAVIQVSVPVPVKNPARGIATVRILEGVIDKIDEHSTADES